MGHQTSIEWTDSSWTPTRARNIKTGKVGWHCEHATTGCEFCYAEGINKRLGTGLPFKPGHRADVEMFLDEKMLLAPLRWKKPRRIFVCSMTDLFADFVTDEMLDRMFAVMALCPQHVFQVLTKRAERMLKYTTRGGPTLQTLAQVPQVGRGIMTANTDWPLPNVWFGVSCERQQEADERIPLLLQTPAAGRFISCEPLLGPLDLSPYLGNNPVYEEQAKRGVRLSGGPERRSRNNAGRNDLASSEAGMGSLAEESGEPPLRASEGGARLREVSPGPNNDRRCEDLRAGSPSGLSSLQGSDPRRFDGEPRGRKEEAQRSGQSGIGDAFRTADPCDSHSEGRSRLRSERPEKQYGEIDARTGSSNPTSPSEWRSPSLDSEGLRNQFSGCVEDSSRRPLGGIVWTIVGGESGPHARPMHPDWARSLRDQCQAAGVPFFFKQWGQWGPINHSDAADEAGWQGRGTWMILAKDGGFDIPDHRWPDEEAGECAVIRVGKKSAGRLLDGREHNDLPAA